MSSAGQNVPLSCTALNFIGLIGVPFIDSGLPDKDNA